MSTNPKREVFRELARVGNALASAVRLELLELLAQGESSVDRLARTNGLLGREHVSALTEAQASRPDPGS